jgi:hypothetical protein
VNQKAALSEFDTFKLSVRHKSHLPSWLTSVSHHFYCSKGREYRENKQQTGWKYRCLVFFHVEIIYHKQKFNFVLRLFGDFPSRACTRFSVKIRSTVST